MYLDHVKTKCEQLLVVQQLFGGDKCGTFWPFSKSSKFSVGIPIFFRSRLLKCFYVSTEGAHDPGELCKYGYNYQAKGESEPRGSHLNPNPRTNKQTNRIFTLDDIDCSRCLISFFNV